MNQVSPKTAAKNAPEKQSKLFQLLPFAWILIPALILFKTVNEYSVNIPMLDDYDTILDFLYKFKTDSGNRLSLLFSLHNEHRIVTSRILYLVYYNLSGGINFETLLIINNLMLIPIFLVGAHFIKKFIPDFWYIPAFIFSLCLFDISGYENSYFTMAGIQNYGVYVSFMLSLYVYSLEGNKYLWLAALLQACCIFSSGNGMLGALALTVYTLFSSNRIKMLTAGTVFIVFTGLYFINYQQPPSSHGMATIDRIIPFFLHEVGAHFDYEMGILAGAIMLILLAITFPISKKLKLHPHAAPLCAILLFALMSLGTAALYRATNKMLDSYASRYFIHNGIITSILFCFIMYKVSLKKIFWPVTGICVVILLFTYSSNYEYGIAGFEREQYRKQMMQYYYPQDKQQYAKDVAENACKTGIYCLEEER